MIKVFAVRCLLLTNMPGGDDLHIKSDFVISSTLPFESRSLIIVLSLPFALIKNITWRPLPTGYPLPFTLHLSHRSRLKLVDALLRLADLDPTNALVAHSKRP